MKSFMEASRSGLARLGRTLADRMIFAHALSSSVEPEPGPHRYQQPLRLIPGMTSAPEPCCLPMHWSEAGHPKHAVAQLKVDGIRALYVDTSIISRQALPLDCALHCLPALADLEKLYGEPMVFDGEYLEPGGFEETISAMRKGEGVGTIWLFDAVPYSEWSKNRFTQRLSDRVARLCALQEKLDSPFVRALGLSPVPTPADAQAFAAEVWARGEEGIVVKNGNDAYLRGKSRLWLKMKKRQTFDGLVVDMLLKDRRCQALLVKMPDDSPSPGKVVTIGSNIPEELREAMARAPDTFQNAVAEIGFNDTTDTGALKGGYFIRLRDDKKVSENG